MRGHNLDEFGDRLMLMDMSLEFCIQKKVGFINAQEMTNQKGRDSLL